MVKTMVDVPSQEYGGRAPDLAAPADARSVAEMAGAGFFRAGGLRKAEGFSRKNGDLW